jgi:predicted transcriptional regulator
MSPCDVLAEEFNKAGKTVPEIAASSGLEEATIQELLDGKRHPRKKEEIAIRKALGLKRLDLYPGFTGQPAFRPLYRMEFADELPDWIHKDIELAVQQSKAVAVPHIHAGLANFFRHIAGRIDDHVFWCGKKQWNEDKGCYEVPAAKADRVQCLTYGLDPEKTTPEELQATIQRKALEKKDAPACSVDLKISSNGKGGAK